MKAILCTDCSEGHNMMSLPYVRMALQGAGRLSGMQTCVCLLMAGCISQLVLNGVLAGSVCLGCG